MGGTWPWLYWMYISTLYSTRYLSTDLFSSGWLAGRQSRQTVGLSLAWLRSIRIPSRKIIFRNSLQYHVRGLHCWLWSGKKMLGQYNTVVKLVQQMYCSVLLYVITVVLIMEMPESLLYSRKNRVKRRSIWKERKWGMKGHQTGIGAQETLIHQEILWLSFNWLW